MRTHSLAFLASLFLVLGGCGGSSGSGNRATPQWPQSGLDTSFVSSTVPTAIPQEGAYGSPTDLDDLQLAALFAWQEFIALNWPAVDTVRDTPDNSQTFGDGGFVGPLVWHTFRGKAETYPGIGEPPGFVNNANADFGYDAPPMNVYDPDEVGMGYTYPSGALPAGQVPPVNDADVTLPTPWINCDESSQLGLCTVYDSNVSDNPIGGPEGRMLFMAKSNRQEYRYVADPATSYYAHGTAFETAVQNWTDAFTTAGAANNAPVGPTISFPVGTIEVKASFRRLAPTDDPSRYYRTTVRYYLPQDPGQTYGGQMGGVDSDDNPYPAWTQATFALVGLHIIHKTTESPYFVYATFEHADNLLNSDGTPSEDANGNLSPLAAMLNPTSPDLSFVDDPVSPLVSALGPYHVLPTPQLYYLNETEFTGIPSGGPICVNRRFHNIPDQVIEINEAVHATIANYGAQEGVGDTVWQNYKLVNVQPHPLDLVADNIAGADAETRANFYLANSTIETDYTLGVFSGKNAENGAPTNYTPLSGEPNVTFNPSYTTADNFQNVFIFDFDDGEWGSWNMGGCMGCHGNAQRSGTDFSFLLDDGRVSEPELADSP